MAVFASLTGLSTQAATWNFDSQDPYQVLGLAQGKEPLSLKQIQAAWARAIVANPYLADQARNFVQNERARNINRARDFLEWQLLKSRRALLSVPESDAFANSWYSTFFKGQSDTFGYRAPAPTDTVAKAADLDLALRGFGEPRISPVWDAVEITRTESRYEKMRMAVTAFLIPYRLRYETAALDRDPTLRIFGLSQQSLGLYQTPLVFAVLFDIWERYSQHEIEISVFNPSGERGTVQGRLVELGIAGDYLEPFFVLEMDGKTTPWRRTISVRFIDFNALLMRTGILRRIYGDFSQGLVALGDNCENASAN